MHKFSVPCPLFSFEKKKNTKLIMIPQIAIAACFWCDIVMNILLLNF